MLWNIEASCESVLKVLPKFLRNIADCCEIAAKVFRKCCERAHCFVARDGYPGFAGLVGTFLSFWWFLFAMISVCFRVVCFFCHLFLSFFGIFFSTPAVTAELNLFVPCRENPIHVFSVKLLPLILKRTTSNLSSFLGCHAPLKMRLRPPSPRVCQRGSGDRSTNVPVSSSKPGSGSSSPSGPRPLPSHASKGILCTRSAENVSHGWGLVDREYVLMHSATRCPPPRKSNVTSRLLSSLCVSEQQVRLPPSSRSEARPCDCTHRRLPRRSTVTTRSDVRITVRIHRWRKCK